MAKKSVMTGQADVKEHHTNNILKFLILWVPEIIFKTSETGRPHFENHWSTKCPLADEWIEKIWYI